MSISLGKIIASEDGMGANARERLAYALPVVPVYFLFGPIAILQGIYAKYFGLSLAAIATVLLSARLFDAVTDPIIGYCSDRYNTQFGSRKPIIICGGLLFIVSSWFLYVPPSNVSADYFLIWLMVFYFSYTLFEIPHLAWGGDLSVGSIDKNKTYGLRSVALLFGALLFFSIPLLPLFETNEFTPQTLKLAVIIAASLMLPLLLICAKYAPNKKNVSYAHEAHMRSGYKKSNLIKALRSIIQNRPFLTLTAAYVCTGCGSGMWITLLFLYVDSFLLLGPYFAFVYITSFGFSLLTIGFWCWLATIRSKQFVWGFGMVLVVIGLLGTGLLSPGKQTWLQLLVCMTLIYSGLAAFNVMVPSLLSDVVDYGTWRCGSDHSATYFSFYTLINKSVGAFGGAISIAIASWYEFDPTMVTHNIATISALRTGVAWIPAILLMLSIVFISQISITSRRHTILCRRLGLGQAENYGV